MEIVINSGASQCGDETIQFIPQKPTLRGDEKNND